MNLLDRITRIPGILGGKPCIRGQRMSASQVYGMHVGGLSHEKILECYPWMEREDIDAAIALAESNAVAIAALAEERATLIARLERINEIDEEVAMLGGYSLPPGVELT